MGWVQRDPAWPDVPVPGSCSLMQQGAEASHPSSGQIGTPASYLLPITDPPDTHRTPHNAAKLAADGAAHMSRQQTRPGQYLLVWTMGCSTCSLAASRSSRACSRRARSALEAAEKPHTQWGAPGCAAVLGHAGTLRTACPSLATSLATSLRTSAISSSTHVCLYS